MRRGQFRIAMPEGKYMTVDGWVSDYFGVFRDEHDAYRLTHLRTGYGMPKGMIRTIAGMREYVKRLESSAIPWEGTIDQIQKHGEKIRSMLRLSQGLED